MSNAQVLFHLEIAFFVCKLTVKITYLPNPCQSHPPLSLQKQKRKNPQKGGNTIKPYEHIMLQGLVNKDENRNLTGKDKKENKGSSPLKTLS